MTTIRELCEMIEPSDRLDELQEPLGKIVDLPFAPRLWIRFLIKQYVEVKHIDQRLGVSRDTAAQAIEESLDKDAVEFIMSESPGDSLDRQPLPYIIVPTSKF
ncbi:unnamed protein product [marine sediment metagenome]|uniref:Uncharacterized protein n=1 Tax=marine sediment metagenome TaxID=412755 RepID=X1U4V3_9ZZZZ